MTYYNYHTFTDHEKISLERMSNFLCGLQALVNFADVALKSLQEVENVIFEGNAPAFENVKKFTKGNEPGTCRLIRTATKAFGEGSGGDQKSGCQGHFKCFVHDFLRENNLRSVPFRAFRGLRLTFCFQMQVVCFST